MGRPKSFEPDAVVARAMDAFWTNGYANTSPAALAEATGIGKGSLYHAFGSKKQLFDRALELYDTAGAEMAAEFLARPGTTRERLRAFMTGLVDIDFARESPRGCLAVNTAIELASNDEDAARAVRKVMDHTVAILAARIERGQRDGDVAPDVDAESFAHFLMNTVCGLRVTTRVFDADRLHRIIDTALAGL